MIYLKTEYVVGGWNFKRSVNYPFRRAQARQVERENQALSNARLFAFVAMQQLCATGKSNRSTGNSDKLPRPIRRTQTWRFMFSDNTLGGIELLHSLSQPRLNKRIPDLSCVTFLNDEMKAFTLSENITFSFATVSYCLQCSDSKIKRKQPQSPAETFLKPSETVDAPLERRHEGLLTRHSRLGLRTSGKIQWDLETADREPCDDRRLRRRGRGGYWTRSSQRLDRWAEYQHLNDLGADEVAAAAAAVRRALAKPSKRHVRTRLHCCRKFQKPSSDRC